MKIPTCFVRCRTDVCFFVAVIQFCISTRLIKTCARQKCLLYSNVGREIKYTRWWRRREVLALLILSLARSVEVVIKFKLQRAKCGLAAKRRLALSSSVRFISNRAESQPLWVRFERRGGRLSSHNIHTGRGAHTKIIKKAQHLARVRTHLFPGGAYIFSQIKLRPHGTVQLLYCRERC